LPPAPIARSTCNAPLNLRRQMKATRPRDKRRANIGSTRVDVSDHGAMRQLLAVLAITTSLGLAAPAHADPATNAGFVNAVGKAGIKFSDNDSAVKAGKTVCALMDLWKTEPEVVDEIAEHNPNISPDKAQRFTSIAQTTYCPQYLPPAQ
jgi:Protein of unknown function (DUF732)